MPPINGPTATAMAAPRHQSIGPWPILASEVRCDQATIAGRMSTRRGPSSSDQPNINIGRLWERAVINDPRRR